MRKNESQLDRILRIIGGIILLVLDFSGIVQGGLAVVALVLGLILVGTGIIGFCPLYALFKFSTKKPE